MRFLIPVTALFLSLGLACGGDGGEATDDEKTEDAAGDNVGGDKSDGSADADDEADEGAAAPRTPGGKSGKGARHSKAGKGGDRGKGGKAQGRSYGDAKVVCCDNGRVQGILREYLDLGEAMARSELNLGEISALSAQATAGNSETDLPPVSRSDSNRIAQKMLEIKDDPDLADLRARWDDISQAMHDLVERHKGSGKYTVVYTHCKMENGGHWLQEGSDLKNPYYGAGKMSGCGQFQ